MPPSCAHLIPQGLPIRAPLDGEDVLSGYPFMAAFSLPLAPHLPPPPDPQVVERLRQNLAEAVTATAPADQSGRDQQGQASVEARSESSGSEMNQSSVEVFRLVQVQDATLRQPIQGGAGAGDIPPLPPALLHSVASALAQGIGAALALSERNTPPAGA